MVLQQFWAEKGCVVLQPLDLEVGAGTFTPRLFSEPLTFESWNTAYVQLCRDRRTAATAKNSPAAALLSVPGHPETVLPKTFKSCILFASQSGIDMSAYLYTLALKTTGIADIRGLGLGWEVWLNGMEVTQFTYFNRSAGRVSPGHGEITYGIERIAMYLQGVDSIYDIARTHGPDDVTYGDVFKQNEVEIGLHL